jgi:hypothetical protein
MMLALLPLVTAAAAGALAPAPEVTTSPRAAQVQLAEALTGADSIESVEARGRTITFSIVRDREMFRVAATTARRGEIVSLAIEPLGPAGAELHGLTWLAAELGDATAIVRLVPSDQGGVLLSTSDGRRYLVTPQRLPRTGNEAVEARWGGAWAGPAPS